MDKQKELLQKLKELATRGVGGEKENAEKLMKRLMKKYHITEEDLKHDEVSDVIIKVNSEYDIRLVSQVLWTLFDVDKLYRVYGTKKKVKTRLTYSQHIEFEYVFSIYKKDFYKELDLFYKAFISKNNIFSKNIKQSSENTTSYEERFKISSYMETIDRSNIRKDLN